MATPTRRVRQSKRIHFGVYMGEIMDGGYGIMDGLRAVHIWIKYINTRVHICILMNISTTHSVPSRLSFPRCRHGDPPHDTTPARYPRDRHALPAARITSPRQPLGKGIDFSNIPSAEPFRGATRADQRGCRSHPSWELAHKGHRSCSGGGANFAVGGGA